MPESLYADTTDTAAGGEDRDGQIERLLLAGLDQYFAGCYEQAIHIWTRVLFLDRRHPRARAYIERARSALVERQRRSEELLDNARTALARGDVSGARAALRALVEQGGVDEEAAALLGRLAQLERVPAAPPSPSRMPVARAGGRPAGREIERPRRRGPLVALAGLAAVAAVFVLGVWNARGPWDVSRRFLPEAPSIASEPLPWPSLGELALARARELYARGRLREALRILDTIGPADPHRAAADELRAAIQQLLIAGADRGSASSLPRPTPP